MFDSVWFSVADMGRAAEFYTAILGRPPSYASEYWTSFDLGNGVLGLHGPGNPDAPVAVGGWVLCLATEDLRSFVERARDAGATTDGGFHQTPRGAIASFHDPDGNRLQAIQLGTKVADLGN